ncbi:hypothetical protein Q3G72_014548 [Acer saccharum]|nr:hypothetical protein Q3G72_014548 [Acer saccharum]
MDFWLRSGGEQDVRRRRGCWVLQLAARSWHELDWRSRWSPISTPDGTTLHAQAIQLDRWLLSSASDGVGKKNDDDDDNDDDKDGDVFVGNRWASIRAIEADDSSSSDCKKLVAYWVLQ